MPMRSMLSSLPIIALLLIAIVCGYMFIHFNPAGDSADRHSVNTGLDVLSMSQERQVERNSVLAVSSVPSRLENQGTRIEESADMRFTIAARDAFRKIFAGGESNAFALLDPLFQEFLSNPTLTRKQKLDTFWQLYLEMPEGIGAQYVLDHLAQLRPFELTEELIGKYPQTTDQMTRVRIRDMIYEGMHRYPEDSILEAEQLELFSRTSVAATDFILGLKNSSDREEASFAFKSGIILVEQDQQVEMIQTMVDQTLNGNTDPFPLTVDELMDTWVTTITSTFNNTELISMLEKTLSENPDLGGNRGLIDSLLIRAEHHRGVQSEAEVLSRIFKLTHGKGADSSLYLNWVKTKLFLEGGINYDEESSVRTFIESATTAEVADLIAADPPWVLQYLASEKIVQIAHDVEQELTRDPTGKGSHSLFSALLYITPSLDDSEATRIGQLLASISHQSNDN